MRGEQPEPVREKKGIAALAYSLTDTASSPATAHKTASLALSEPSSARPLMASGRGR